MGLTYVAEDLPGITRVRRGKGFSFHGPDGRLLNGSERERVLSLAVPPAWREVWICPTPDGHVQARGLDDAERRQYRYHDRWTEGRRMANFDRLRGMGNRLAPLRRELDTLLLDGTDPVRQATAAMVRLVDGGMARIGGPRSVQEHGHFGVSTLQRDHVDVRDRQVTLTYPGKSGVQREVHVADELLAEVLDQLELASDTLFHVHAEGELHRLSAADANALLAELTAGWMTCKDFRTWGGSAVALEAMVVPILAGEQPDPVAAVDAAAAKLGNTRAVARSSYVHPSVLEADPELLVDTWKAARSSTRFDRRERALVKLLEATPPLLDAWINRPEEPAGP